MDSDEGKIYVSGISRDTDENILREYFSKFGEVLDVKVIRDKATGLNLGFAFVAFLDPAAVDRVLQNRHEIDNQYVDVKRRTSGEVQNPAGRSGNLNSSRSFDSGANVRTKEIFVGGLPLSLTLQEFQAYFEKYGAVSDAVIMIDQPTQRPRGFGFVSFYSENAVHRVLDETFHYLNGKQVEVKRRKVASGGGGVTGGFPVYGGSGGSGYEGCMNSNRYMQPQNTGSGYYPLYGYGYGSNIVGGGAGASSGGGGAGEASGGRGAGAFPGYGGSSGSGYEGHMDSNRYMQLQNTGSGNPPYGASGYGGYGYLASAPYGDPGVAGASGPSSSWGAQVPSGYGNVEYGNAAPRGGFRPGSAVREQVVGSAGYGHGGVGGYGYPAGAPYSNPVVPGACGPSSSWGAQVSSSYGNVEYGNAARGGGFGPGSAVREQVGGSAGYGYGGNDSWYGTPSAYGAVDGQSGNIHNTHGSGSGYADASNVSGGYGNHQRNNRQAGSGGSFGKDRQAQQ